MKKIALISLFTVFCAPAAYSSGSAVWPAEVIEKDDPGLMAFYDGQCAQYADQNGLTGEARQTYVQSCRSRMSDVFPAGQAEGGGDE